MAFQKIKIFISILGGLFILVAFNNCGAGFDGSGTNPNSSLGATPELTEGSSFSTARKLGANRSSPFRMLTSFEVKNSLEDIFSISLDEMNQTNLLPQFSEELFSNFQEDVNVSRVHVDGIKKISQLVNEKISDQKLKELIPCLTSELNSSCKNEIIDFVTLNLFRKNIDATLRQKYTQFFNAHTAKPIYGTRLLIQAAIQSPSFLMRHEVGGRSGTTYLLNSFEVASRMSYFITGSGPDKILLELASANQLVKPEIRQQQALRLFKSEKAKRNIYNINKEIFRIDKLGIDRSLASLFTQETEMLFEDVIFEKNLPWTELFTSSGSYLNSKLASHYGLSGSSAKFVWTPYSGKRQGILSHGSFLSYQFTGDPELTSPIKRGLQIVEDLLCKHLPPPSDVDIDNDPAAKLTNECKIVARKKTTLHPKSSCFGCHTFMEPLGLSLERFNMLGQYRSHEKNRKECTTIEPGQIDRQEFNSMQELGSIMAEHQDINLCLTKRVLAYAFGNRVENENVMAYYGDLKAFNSDKTFKSLVMGIVTSPQFIRRDL